MSSANYLIVDTFLGTVDPLTTTYQEARANLERDASLSGWSRETTAEIAIGLLRIYFMPGNRLVSGS